MAIKLKANQWKCKNCGGEIKFNPSGKNLKCFSCGTVEDFEKSKEIPKHDINEKIDTSSYNQWIKENKFLKCFSCGANVSLGKYETTQVCPYCGTNIMSQVTELPGIKPDAIVPFSFDENEARTRFANAVKKSFFVPNAFKKSLPLDKIHGVYVPVFSFDCDTTSTYSGDVVEREYVITDEGHKSIETHRSISGIIDCKHRNVTVETSSKLSDYDLQRLSPFDFGDCYKYDQKFIKGYSVEHYQEQMDQCRNIAKNKYDRLIEKAIKSKHNATDVENLTVSTKYSNEKYSYNLFPIYNFEYTYDKKSNVAIMNGQSGKVGVGLPVSKAKVALAIALGLVAFALVGLLIYKLINAGV